MVYGGKPSRGCQTCKTRKIKCDEARPTCLQCKKSSRTCLGYPNEADLIFRNENDRIVEKSRKSQKPRTRASISPDGNISETTQNAGTIQLSTKHRLRPIQHLNMNLSSMTSCFNTIDFTTTILPPPALPIEEQVVLVYFKNFKTLYQNEDTVQNFLPYLVPMYAASTEGSALRLATRATALCAISQLPAQRQLTQKATQMYSKAIMAVAGALQDPVEALSDETLQATLLLCLYESIRASDKSINAWSHHVDGASAIVRARGVGQFENLQSLSLFRATRTQMITNCIRQEIAPPEFPGEEGWLSDSKAGGDTLRALAWCALELPSLLALAKGLLKQERTPTSLVAMSDLIERAYALQNRMTTIPRHLDTKFQPRTVAYVPEEPLDLGNAEAWVGPVHEYSDVHIGGVLNKLRSCCMFSTWIVMDCIQWLSPDSFTLDGRWQHSRYVERVTIDDICSSVPFHLNWKSETKKREFDQVETIADMIGGLSLVWPLGGAVYSPRISATQKAWIWGRLRKIAQDCGLEQASLLETDVKNVLDSFLNRPLYGRNETERL